VKFKLSLDKIVCEHVCVCACVYVCVARVRERQNKARGASGSVCVYVSVVCVFLSLFILYYSLVNPFHCSILQGESEIAGVGLLASEDEESLR